MTTGGRRPGGGFEERSREIKVKAISTFFDEEKHLRTLERQFPKSGRLDQLRHLREYPYKFGVRMILADRHSERSADYHRTKATREGFELLKVLHDQADHLTGEEAAYVKEKINDCVAYPKKDFSPLLLELDLCRSTRERCDAVSIGDGSATPDVSLVAAGRRYDVQCKSVGGGEQESKALHGFCSLLNSLARQSPKLAASARHSAWRVRNASAFASSVRVGEAHDQIMEFCDAHIEGHHRFRYQTESLGYMGDGSSKHATLAHFLGFVEATPGIAPYRPALSCNVFASAVSPAAEWSVVFYSERDIGRLAKRCADRFRTAMHQHDSIGSAWPVVAINVEASHIVDDPSSDGFMDPALSPGFQAAVNLDRKVIADTIARLPSWQRCYGLLLTFTLPAVLSPAGGVGWLRVRSWHSRSGGSFEEEFPVFQRR